MATQPAVVPSLIPSAAVTPSKRLAIVIAGAVSLGSYEAGVLYEVLDAIHHHNNDKETLANPADRIVVDVLTGASAGGMTAIILAQKLLFSADEFVGPYNNPLHNVWVDRIDLSGLQQTQPEEPALHSLFSSDLIQTISRETLLSRYASSPPPPPRPHAAVDGSLRVGVALTNLNGVDYGYKVEPNGEFVYREYSDQLTRMVDASSDNPVFWEPLRRAAVACGAFPIAFRAQDVDRHRKGGDQDDYASNKLWEWKHDPRIFTYCDGGVLQNQPLGMAKNLVDLIPGHLDQERRFYLFVSPHAKDASEVDSFSEQQADYAHLLARLVKVVIGQSGFRDWITAQQINERIHLLDDRASGLKDAILDHGIAPSALQETATSLLTLLFPDGSHQPPGARVPETLDKAKARITHQYREEIGELSTAERTKPELAGAALAFRDSILAFESAAGLGARDAMCIYGITAKESELAGAGLQAFLGFFDRVYREHDYNVGRLHARSVLNDEKLSEKGNIGPLRGLELASPIDPVDTRLDGLSLAHVAPADLKEFKTGTRQRVNQMIDELTHHSWFESEAVKTAVDPILNIVLDWLIHMS
jgi:predicted acylesterase/phospholipase RssA